LTDYNSRIDQDAIALFAATLSAAWFFWIFCVFLVPTFQRLIRHELPTLRRGKRIGIKAVLRLVGVGVMNAIPFYQHDPKRY
jgi:hypothetical protein